MNNKSFCKSDAFQFFVVQKNKLSAARLSRIISDDKIITHKSLDYIWRIAGNEFKELSHIAKQNFYSPAYLQEQRFVGLLSIKTMTRNKIEVVLCLIQAVNNIYT